MFSPSFVIFVVEYCNIVTWPDATKTETYEHEGALVNSDTNRLFSSQCSL